MVRGHCRNIFIVLAAVCCLLSLLVGAHSRALTPWPPPPRNLASVDIKQNVYFLGVAQCYLKSNSLSLQCFISWGKKWLPVLRFIQQNIHQDVLIGWRAQVIGSPQSPKLPSKRGVARCHFLTFPADFGGVFFSADEGLGFLLPSVTSVWLWFFAGGDDSDVSLLRPFLGVCRHNGNHAQIFLFIFFFTKREKMYTFFPRLQWKSNII